MKTFFIILFSTMLFATSCIKEEDVDKEKPIINNSGISAFPVNCDTLYFGDTIVFSSFFSDNFELGSYSIDIHHNFDHHSHSTDIANCAFDNNKTAQNPFTFIEDFPIQNGLKEIQISKSIFIMSENENGKFDEGDYHFYISLTDKNGWSSQKGISIKILQH